MLSWADGLVWVRPRGGLWGGPPGLRRRRLPLGGTGRGPAGGPGGGGRPRCGSAARPPPPGLALRGGGGMRVRPIGLPVGWVLRPLAWAARLNFARKLAPDHFFRKMIAGRD